MANNRPHVLVADDQPLIGWALTQALQPLGFDVSVAGSRAEACGRLYAERYSHIVMAASIGEVDMTDVIGEIACFQPLTRLFVLTEPGATELPSAAQPMATVFEKPFEISALARALGSDVDDHRVATTIPA